MPDVTVALPVGELTLTGSPVGFGGDVSISLPVGELTFAAPTLSAQGDVVIGLPCGELKLAGIVAWPANTGTGGGGGAGQAPGIKQAPPDAIVASVYATNGFTRLAQLPTIRNAKWQIEISKPGAATFEVPLDDATTALLTDRRIVRLQWIVNGAVRAQFGCRLESEAVAIAVDGRQWLRFEDQPGVMSMVGDAVVYPEYYANYGISGASWESARNFGYMSGQDFWMVPGAWVTPRGLRWDFGNLGSNIHFKTPVDFKIDPACEWISRWYPNTTQPFRAVNYFRTIYTLTEPADVQIMAAFDNYGDMYHDGDLVFAADYSQLKGWTTAQTKTLRVPAGNHVIAARVENGPLLGGPGPNPVAMICEVRHVGRDGKPGALIRRTNTTDWVTADDYPQPGFTRAQVLRRLLLEADTRGVYGPNHIPTLFTYDRDTNGQAWTDRGNYTIDVGTVSLVDVIAQLTEADMDVVAETEGPKLLAYKRLGKDRRATVHLSWGEPAGSFKQFETQVTNTRYTAGIAQLSTGEWVEVDNAAGIAAIGRVEVGLQLASTGTDLTAGGVMARQLEESAQPVVAITSQTSLLVGAQPWVHYFLGDTITVPNARDTGTMAARVMSLTVDGTGDAIQAYPELVKDLS